MADESDSPLEFPCRYPVKAMVRTSAEARTAVLTAISRHTEFSHRADVRVRPSRNGRFESITVTVEATSREHLENIYADVRSLDFVVMML
jgi:putative lipoic acid-binding regulatory protein